MNQDCIITEPAIPVNQFHREGNNFMAEAGELPNFSIRSIFNDAVDVGIVVSGKNRAGQHRFFPFTLVDIGHDAEGGVEFWVFKNLRGTSTITVFND